MVDSSLEAVRFRLTRPSKEFYVEVELYHRELVVIKKIHVDLEDLAVAVKLSEVVVLPGVVSGAERCCWCMSAAWTAALFCFLELSRPYILV